MDNYKDIINMPRHISKTRHPMSLHDRAAQFAPFAALTGYDSAISETARLTDSKLVLGPEETDLLNARLLLIKDRISEKPTVEIVFFVPDEKKAGGAYKKFSGRVRRIDEVKRLMIFNGGSEIPLDDIAAVDII